MSTRRVESFLLRIVVSEDEALTPDHWRGRIQHIASGTELQINELAQVVAFITEHLGPLSGIMFEIEEEPIGGCGG